MKKNSTFWNIRRIILNSHKEDLLVNLEKIFNRTSHDLLGLTIKHALSWDQIRVLSEHPLVTIGTHTINHLALSKLTEQEVLTEINESIKLIEDNTGKHVLYLAYPFGSSNEANIREFRIAEQCNLKMAFTTKQSNIFRYHSKHLMALPRIEINENWRVSHYDLFINGLTPFINKLLKFRNSLKC